MKYRENRRTGDKISEIGMGTAYIAEAERSEAVKTVRHAYESGINYYDLARIGDDMATEHYRALEKNASDCVSCGHCNSRCPFMVNQMNRMQEIKEYFGHGAA